ncbi:MAG TPA: hypothetical protein VKC51_10710 [Lacunisphaera sp.]|nr:hypothetical protein [Lacunisphaera sp.]
MKKFFSTRSLRERLLLMAFALIAFGWWAPVALGRLGALRRDWSALNAERATQQMWLSHRGEIEARAAAAGRTLDPAKTLDASQAFAELNRMAAGLTAEIGAQRTERTEQFALHSVQVSIRRADLAGLLHFYDQLGERAPYLGIEQCVVSADRANPGLLNAVFRISSIEALRPAK